MSGMEYGLGHFGDLRLKKGGPVCTRRWWSGQVRVSAGWGDASTRDSIHQVSSQSVCNGCGNGGACRRGYFCPRART